MATIDDLLTNAAKEGASDVYLKSGCFPVIRVHGEMRAAKGWPRLTGEDTSMIAAVVMNDHNKERFKEESEVDLSYSIAGIGRFRCNIYRQRGSVGLVFRVVATTIRTIKELNLPPILERLAEERRGMVLVTGSTGAGKSTTLAAMIEQLNNTRNAHIVTVEDPIEFSYRDKKAYIIQRELDSDTLSFKKALRGALRQNPDVIMVGEMRDHDTIETALMAAAAGALVMSSLHTMDATETIQRIVSMFPSTQQLGIRMQLASVLRAVVSVRLVRRADGQGRIPAVEIMRVTGMIRECIINAERTNDIRELIAKGRESGMQTFDQALFELYQKKIITMDEAIMNATVPDDFKLWLKGLQVATAGQVMSNLQQAS